MKAIIVYFSYMGNTKKIAEMIRDKIGGDIVRIETVVPIIRWSIKAKTK